MNAHPVGLPVIIVRPGEGRSGSTLMMQVLGTGREIVFDRRYPSEYRFLSYFCRLAEQMTEPFDEQRHVGVTPFFFGDRPSWGPIPFATEVIDVAALRAPLVRGLWTAWSDEVLQTAPDARFYAEKIAVPIADVRSTGLGVRTIDLVRDPRDVLASIRAFTARGIDGFGRTPGIDEDAYLDAFVGRTARHLDELLEDADDATTTIVRYEELVADLATVADRLGSWLGVELDAAAVQAARASLAHHMTSDTAEASIGRWQNDLAPEEADRIIQPLVDRLRRVGYDV